MGSWRETFLGSLKNSFIGQDKRLNGTNKKFGEEVLFRISSSETFWMQ